MAFNPLDYPLAWENPLYLSVNADFIGHIPLAMALVDLLRPRTFVELGTHIGMSYCAFCQAVSRRNLNTRCFGVDTWRGDASMKNYGDGDAILAELQKYHDPRFSQFSTLMRMTFDQAAPQFEAGSIDLLHIDGCHTYEAVSHDFDTWLPKLSPGGVVLFHDTSERRVGFGVWRFWEEVSAKFPSFNFEHSHGLGILLAGPNPPEAMRAFIQTFRDSADQVRQFFSFAGDRLRQLLYYQVLIGQAWRTQEMINQWCGLKGLPQYTRMNDVAQARQSPLLFTLESTAHIRDVLGRDIAAVRAPQP